MTFLLFHRLFSALQATVLQAMQVQNYVWGPAIMTFITAVANVPINMVLIRYYDFWGAALATSVARILLLVLLVGEYSIPLAESIQPNTYCSFAASFPQHFLLMLVCNRTFSVSFFMHNIHHNPPKAHYVSYGTNMSHGLHVTHCTC